MDFWSTDSYCQAVDVDRRSDSRHHLFGKCFRKKNDQT